jgi:hypothetical protein
MSGRSDNWQRDDYTGEVYVVRICQSGGPEADVDLRPVADIGRRRPDSTQPVNPANQVNRDTRRGPQISAG